MNTRSFGEYKKTKSSVAWVSFIIYLILSGVVLWTCIDFYLKHTNIPVLVQIFILYVSVTFILFNYPQILNLAITMVGFFRRKKIYALYDTVINTTITNQNYKVAILYVTKDDFIPEALNSALIQTYKNFDVFVLDDSTNPSFIKSIKDFQSNHNFTIIRREGVGPKNKAGNINNFLQNYIDKYDYIAILDSDSYVQKDFLYNSLKYFDYFNDVGIVQAANNIFVNCQNAFQDLCAPSYSSNKYYWTTDYIAGSEYGIFLCNGHGCVISTKALKAVGGMMPPFISEDWSLSVDIKQKGYYVVYAPNVYTFEEIPPNYVAYKKRMLRWETGAYQFTTTYIKRVLKTNFKLHEKVHILYGACNSWITPFFSVISTVLSSALLFQLQNAQQLPWAAWVISLLFMCLSLASVGGKSFISKTKASQTIKSILGIAMICSSMLPSLFVKSFMLFFGKKEFKVTIKHNWTFRWYDTFKYNWIDIVGWTLIFGFTIAAMVVSGYWQWSINPFLWVTFAGYISIFFMPLLSNKQLKKRRNNDMYQEPK